MLVIYKNLIEKNKKYMLKKAVIEIKLNPLKMTD